MNAQLIITLINGQIQVGGDCPDMLLAMNMLADAQHAVVNAFREQQQQKKPARKPLFLPDGSIAPLSMRTEGNLNGRSNGDVPG